MSDGGAYSPFRSTLLVLTHDFIIICVYGPTGSDGHEWMLPTRTLVAHHFWPFEAKGVLYVWGPSSQPTVPLHELPPARLVIHRQTSAHERRKWTRSVQSRSGILAYLCTRHMAVDNGRAPHSQRAPRGGCCSGGRSLRSCTPSFGLGTTKP